MLYLSTEGKEETEYGTFRTNLSQRKPNKAYKKVYQNKGVSGVDGTTVEEIADYIKENKDRITNKIRKRQYKLQPVKRVQIPKENGKKINLGIPTVMDRIIQQAIVQILTPIFEEQFHDNSYGFRPGRSCEQALIKVLEYLNDGYDWIVDIDLEKFFNTVNQDKLITIIGKTIKDGDVVLLIRKYLSAGVMVNGVKTEIAYNLANTRKGYQFVCKTDWTKFAINIKKLRKRGLVFLLDQYTKVHIECTN